MTGSEYLTGYKQQKARMPWLWEFEGLLTISVHMNGEDISATHWHVGGECEWCRAIWREAHLESL